MIWISKQKVTQLIWPLKGRQKTYQCPCKASRYACWHPDFPPYKAAWIIEWSLFCQLLLFRSSRKISNMISPFIKRCLAETGCVNLSAAMASWKECVLSCKQKSTCFLFIQQQLSPLFMLKTPKPTRSDSYFQVCGLTFVVTKCVFAALCVCDKLCRLSRQPPLFPVAPTVGWSRVCVSVCELSNWLLLQGTEPNWACSQCEQPLWLA